MYTVIVIVIFFFVFPSIRALLEEWLKERMNESVIPCLLPWMHRKDARNGFPCAVFTTTLSLPPVQ